jgi:hypothetical protein
MIPAAPPGERKRSEQGDQRPAPQPPAAEKKEAKGDDDKPGLGLQAGLGGQTLARGPHQPFLYAQVSAEASNVYVASLKGPGDLGPYLSRVFKSISFVGEPGFTLQYHMVGDSPKQVDAQFLGKLVQLSLEHVDVSAVAGVGYNALFKTPDLSRVALLGGLEVEPQIVKAGPVTLSWVLDGLATIPHYDKPAYEPKTAPAPSRRLDGQFSGELRLKFEF